ncbi:MAG: serine--tRNA ligase [Candidatus Nanoarchaeia archaeon]
MIDINLIRQNPDLVKENSKNRGYDEKVVEDIIKYDKKWRKLKKQDDNLRHDRNKISEEINNAKKQKKNTKGLIKKAKQISEKLKKNEKEEATLKNNINNKLALIPNIQAKDVPIGGEKDFKEISRYGNFPKIKNPKTHVQIGKGLDMLDMERGAKVAGAGFYILKDKLARLERALINFMLDFHIKNDFIEINPPQLVNAKTMFGTGNLPKFEEDLYKTNENLYAVPTAEVPVTNLHSNEILYEKELPKKYCAFTQCYRTEAGRHAGEEGLFRLHEFEKVEMVYISHPKKSWDYLEEMTSHAEELLKQLELPFRRIVLATEDASFASAKTYDLEVYSVGINRWLEVSSCSNCLEFQARRMNSRFQSSKTNKPEFVHTLNGSGLATPRLLIALLENNQQKDGSVKVPKALWPYTGFREIKPKK